jgi:hypothetical protein
VRAFIEAYGDSRFFAAWEANPERVTTRAGYRRQTSRGWEYFVLPEQWQGELPRGFDASALAFAMIERGLMKGERIGSDKPKSSIRLTVRGQEIRLYHLPPKILE